MLMVTTNLHRELNLKLLALLVGVELLKGCSDGAWHCKRRSNNIYRVFSLLLSSVFYEIIIVEAQFVFLITMET